MFAGARTVMAVTVVKVLVPCGLVTFMNET